MSLSVCVSRILFSKTGSMNGAISFGVPHRAEPYSTPCRYFFAFFPFRYTASFTRAAPASPIHKSCGWKLGKTFWNASEKFKKRTDFRFAKPVYFVEDYKKLKDGTLERAEEVEYSFGKISYYLKGFKGQKDGSFEQEKEIARLREEEERARSEQEKERLRQERLKKEKELKEQQERQAQQQAAKQAQQRAAQQRTNASRGGQGRSIKQKTPVMGLLSDGKVYARVIKNASSKVLLGII